MQRSFPKSAYFALIAVGGVALLGGYLYWRQQKPPVAGTPLYQSLVTDFYSGEIALQAGDLNHAKQYLTRFTQNAPQEPTGWANLGILQTRLSNYEAAAKSLQKAQRLAPQNAQIEAALADLESIQGHTDAAIPHLRRVLELSPSNIKASYALAQALNNAGDAKSNTEVRSLYDQILKTEPNNIVVLIEALRLAAASGDNTKFQSKLGQLRGLSANWPPEVKEEFKNVETAAKGNVRAAAIALIPFTNLLKPTLIYQSALAEFGANNETGTVRSAEPFESFLWLQPATPVVQASPPDLGLKFAAQPFGTFKTPVNTGNAFYLDDKGTPVSFATKQEGGQLSLWKLTGSPSTQTFPAGASQSTSTPSSLLGLDWNFDFKNDLLLANSDGLRLLLQNGSGNFTDATSNLKLPPAVLKGDYYGAWAADIEADGDLDVVVAPRAGSPFVLRNNGDGTATVVQPFAGIQNARDFIWADFNDDGAVDAAFLDDKGAIHVFFNQRVGVFAPAVSPDKGAPNLTLAAGDVNQDGLIDIVALRQDGTLNRLSYDTVHAGWNVASLGSWKGLPAKANVTTNHLLIADLDNNGSSDIVASTEGNSQIWLSDEKNVLQPLPSSPSATIFSAIDFNGDGRLDLLGIDAQGVPVQLINQGTLPYHWQLVRPIAQNVATDGGAQTSGNQRINPFGVGGTIELRSGLQYQKQVISGPVAHFGLGSQTSTDSMRLIWPNGVAQAEFEITADQSIKAEQRLIGSCPFLWGFDGKGIHFIKDCNWRSPLGLRINGQDTAGVVQTQDWVKVDGAQLQPTKGSYDLRVTADLWEAHIFDYLSLMTVDHPQNSEVWVDERFSIPMPPLRVIVTGKAQPIASAHDDNGNDVTAKVSQLDGDYLDNFGRGQYQGVSRDHWVEVELPANAPTQGPLWLIAQGWLHPTDSSINVALSQGHHAPPRDLSLEVANAQGGWDVVQPHLGFPSGKNKSIVLDLKDVFRLGAPRRVRLRTNMEIYWDRLVWAGAPAGEATNAANAIHQQRLLPTTAELRYRGVSDLEAKNASSPELPGPYEEVKTGQPWRDLVGFYTRFGDVRPLLNKVDDRYVIMNAGDEMRLRFSVPAPPRAGWKRDFVFITDGWTKDGNLNTAYSRTLLPLPLHSQPRYNQPPVPLQDDPAYRKHPQDWQTYQTRYVSTEGFLAALRPRK